MAFERDGGECDEEVENGRKTLSGWGVFLEQGDLGEEDRRSKKANEWESGVSDGAE